MTWAFRAERRSRSAWSVTLRMMALWRPMPLAAYRPASTTASSCSSEGISAVNERQLLRSTMASMTSLTALPTLLSIIRPLQRQIFRPPFYALSKAPRQEALLTQVKNLQVAFLPQTENRVPPLVEKPIPPKEPLPVRFFSPGERPYAEKRVPAAGRPQLSPGRLPQPRTSSARRGLSPGESWGRPAEDPTPFSPRPPGWPPCAPSHDPSSAPAGSTG